MAAFRMSLLLVLMGVTSLAAETVTLETLKQPAPMPNWADKQAVTVQPGKPWSAFRNSRRNERDMQRSTGQLRYAIDNKPNSADRPFLMVQLARHWADLDEDVQAYQAAQAVLDLPEGTRTNRRVQIAPTLDAVKREARFIQARVLARNDLRDETLAVMKAIPPQNGHEYARHAEIVSLLGGTQAAQKLLQKAHGGGNPDRGFSDVFVRLRSAVLARGIGDDNLALYILEPLHRRGKTAQKWPQWQSSWEILDTLKRNISRGKPVGSELHDGRYTGQCQGFVGPVGVQVRVVAGKIDSVKVGNHGDNRPWSAMEVMPRRIEKHKSLNVDIVTGATVSSSAVLVATDHALNAARKAGARDGD